MNTRQNKFFFLCTLMILLSCGSSEKSELLIIPIDVYQDESFRLSDISEKIDVIELETTENSLIGRGGRFGRMLVSNDYILYYDRSDFKILLFDSKGKFLRQISKRGQGPGEYVGISDITTDFKNNRIYFQTTSNKLICYDFDGNFINEVSPFNAVYLNFYNNTLNAIKTYIASGDLTDNKINTVLYEINNNLQIVDSLIISSISVDKGVFMHNADKHYITNTDGDIYLYYPLPTNQENLDNYFIRDTLYQLNGKDLTPYLKLMFSDEKSQPIRSIEYVYRSSRYVFTRYLGKDDSGFFCFDLKTGKGKNMKHMNIDDDIHTEARVLIKPFDSDTDKFYYLHTNIDDSDKEEPNPTLYIGTLKK